MRQVRRKTISDRFRAAAMWKVTNDDSVLWAKYQLTNRDHFRTMYAGFCMTDGFRGTPRWSVGEDMPTVWAIQY